MSASKRASHCPFHKSYFSTALFCSLNAFHLYGEEVSKEQLFHKIALKIITFSPSRPVSWLHSPINTRMGSCRLNTHSSRLKHGNSSLFREGKLLHEILCPSFWQTHFVQRCTSSPFPFLMLLDSWKWTTEPSADLRETKKNGLSCLNHHLILCLCPTYPPLSRIALHCALTPSCSGWRGFFPISSW